LKGVDIGTVFYGVDLIRKKWINKFQKNEAEKGGAPLQN